MTATAKELLDALNTVLIAVEIAPLTTQEHADARGALDTLKAALDRPARYDAAVPEEVGPIAERVERLKGPAFENAAASQLLDLSRDLLAVVARQGEQIGRARFFSRGRRRLALKWLVAYRSQSHRVEAQRDDIERQRVALRERREEIDHLKSALSAYERPMEDAELAKVERAHTIADKSPYAIRLRTLGDEKYSAHFLTAHQGRGILLSALRRERAEKEAIAQQRLLYLGSLAFLASNDEMPLVVRAFAVNVINDTPGKADDIVRRAKEVAVRVSAELQRAERLAKETGKS